MSNVFEEKNTQKAILKLGLPAILGQLATLIYNMADTYFVSMTNNAAQIAAVTLSMPILLIIMSVSSVCGMGGSSVIARLLGEKNTKSAKSSVSFCFYAMIAAGVAILCFGMLFITPVAKLAGADSENLAFTCDYLKWIFLCAPFIILSNGMVHIFRSTGLIKEATMGVIIGNGINIVLDWLFIVRMDMGTAGAAAATSIGFLCATVYNVACMLRKSTDKNLYSLSPKHISISGELFKNIIKIGIPGALITILLSVSNIVLNNTIGIYGSDAVAAYGIALGGMFTVLFLTLSQPLSAIFLHEQALIEQSALFLRILCLSAPMLGIINMVTAYYQALGKAFNSLFITLMRNILLFIPCVLLLNKLFGLNGVISTQCVVETGLAVICMVMYLKSRNSATSLSEKNEASAELSAVQV
ncbi:MAG: polysaccharide biosynthesis C-terminal domain-containing protein [Ruminococcus sp.]|uniref:MATE family efflux transporter n=1 Tax=Ruminococcus sp. TaxID=41978 RepID=UPI0025E6DD0F|nr:MATE family efflux transporter [Ruminococcus sp.]MCR5599410.1 polysaccharide biosynthesis C-terminal domain-containing protein [Ruminococcus sp.]